MNPVESILIAYPSPDELIAKIKQDLPNHNILHRPDGLEEQDLIQIINDNNVVGIIILLSSKVTRSVFEQCHLQNQFYHHKNHLINTSIYKTNNPTA